MAYTYNDFLNAANSSGMLSRISQSDQDLAKQYPEFGLSLLSLTKDIDSATTAEQKLLATEAAEQLRSAYSTGASYGSQIAALQKQADSYGSFSYDKENAYQKALASVTNPTSFEYEVEDDPVYSAYRKQYLREGDRAVADTLAKVSAATGGRPSSYAVSAAQQAGDYYNSQLTDVIPTLYQNAYQRYLNDIDLQRGALEVLSADREAASKQHLSNYELILGQLEQLQAEREALLSQQIEGAATNILSGGLGGSINSALNQNNATTLRAPVLYPFAQQKAENAMGPVMLNRFNNTMDTVMGNYVPATSGPGTNAGLNEVDTPATRSFKGSVMTRREFSRTGDTYKSYEDYLAQMIDQRLSRGELTDDEAATLMQYYGLV